MSAIHRFISLVAILFVAIMPGTDRLFLRAVRADVPGAQQSNIDMAVASIDSPVNTAFGCSAPTGLQVVSVTLRNQGALALPAGTMGSISFTVNGNAAVFEALVLNSSLSPNASLSYTFSTAANLPLPGPNLFVVTVLVTGDGNAANDAKSVTLTAAGYLPASTLPWVEDFDSAASANPTTPPLGWSQDLLDAAGPESDWYFQTGSTPTAQTGPIGDHTTGNGFYAFVEDSGASHAQVNLISPCLDLRGVAGPLARFWVHSFNTAQPLAENSLAVDVIVYPGGALSMSVFGPLGHIADASHANSLWHEYVVSLSPFAGQIVQLQFRGRSDGGGDDHDIAIDDVSVISGLFSFGGPPRAGLAVLDINGALEGNGYDVNSGLNGPYFGTATQGGPFVMSFAGHPNQFITVLYGPLNPASATYFGGIGQFDIGGPGFVLGLPANIGVFVNAIGWAQSGFAGLPIDAFFLTGSAGTLTAAFTLPNYGIPSNTILTTFQAAITSPSAPFVYLSNAVEVTIIN